MRARTLHYLTLHGIGNYRRFWKSSMQSTAIHERNAAKFDPSKPVTHILECVPCEREGFWEAATFGRPDGLRRPGGTWPWSLQKQYFINECKIHDHVLIREYTESHPWPASDNCMTKAHHSILGMQHNIILHCWYIIVICFLNIIVTRYYLMNLA